MRASLAHLQPVLGASKPLPHPSSAPIPEERGGALLRFQTRNIRCRFRFVAP
jgi:hypothetical protein